MSLVEKSINHATRTLQQSIQIEVETHVYKNANRYFNGAIEGPTAQKQSEHRLIGLSLIVIKVHVFPQEKHYSWDFEKIAVNTKNRKFTITEFFVYRRQKNVGGSVL